MCSSASMAMYEDVVFGKGELERLAQPGVPLHLKGCSLSELDLTGIQMPGWILEQCDLQRTKLHAAMLEGTQWLSCRASFADFTAADLTESTFNAGFVNNTKFCRSKVQGSSFTGCRLTGADFTGCRGFDVTFHEVSLVLASLPGLSFRNTALSNVNFSEADLTKCDFRGATFERCSLREAVLDGARFEGADLRDVDLTGLKIADLGRFKGAKMSSDQAAQLIAGLGIKVV